MKKVLLLFNPKSRSGAESLEEATQWLKNSKFEVVTWNPEADNRDVNDLIVQSKNQLDFVVVGGGDGSVNHILPGLVKTQLPVLVVPLGTANNLARTYNLPGKIPDALELLRSGNTQQVDVGVVNDIYFVNVAGMGLSTEVNRKVSRWLKRHLGVFAFIITALQLAPRIRPFIADITCGLRKIRSTSLQITVCNGRHYGSGLTIQEDATLEDKTLHCLSTEVNKWWKSFKLIPAMMTGRYKKNHEVALVAGSSIRIDTNRPLRIDVDGDIKTKTPAVFTVLPRALNLLIPVKSEQK